MRHNEQADQNAQDAPSNMKKHAAPSACTECMYSFKNAAEKHQQSKYQDARNRCRGHVHTSDDAEHNEQEPQNEEPSPSPCDVFGINGECHIALLGTCAQYTLMRAAWSDNFTVRIETSRA